MCVIMCVRRSCEVEDGVVEADDHKRTFCGIKHTRLHIMQAAEGHALQSPNTAAGSRPQADGATAASCRQAHALPYHDSAHLHSTESFFLGLSCMQA